MKIPLVSIPEAIALLKKGEVVAYPTETVYGLAVDATNPKAVQKIFDLKGRTEQSPLLVLIQTFQQLPDYVKPFPMRAQELIDQYWPGPLTLVFEAKEKVFPKELLAGTGKVALRVSSDPIAFQLCADFGLPITSTSANPSGKKPAQSPEEVQAYFADLVLCKGCIDGGKRQSKEVSTVLDISVEPFRLIREGKIRASKLKGFL